MISYRSSRHGHACPAVNYFKVTFLGTFTIWSESVLYSYDCCMSCILSCCWSKFQSIHLILEIHCNRRRETLSMPKYSSPLPTRSSFKRFLYCGSKVLGVVVLCWSEEPHVGFPPALSEDFLPRYRFCRHPLPPPTMLPFTQTYFIPVFQKPHKDIRGF